MKLSFLAILPPPSHSGLSPRVKTPIEPRCSTMRAMRVSVHRLPAELESRSVISGAGFPPAALLEEVTSCNVSATIQRWT